MRLDKWLWAARLFKTRQVAVKAISAGHVQVNGARAKPARVIKPGDELTVRKVPYTYVIHIQALAERRGPASQARLLYTESEASELERQRLAAELKTRASQILYDPKKPSRREQRTGRSRKRGEL